jgi:hypothetical protein
MATRSEVPDRCVEVRLCMFRVRSVRQMALPWVEKPEAYLHDKNGSELLNDARWHKAMDAVLETSGDV